MKRRLSADEAALWAQVARTVQPMAGRARLARADKAVLPPAIEAAAPPVAARPAGSHAPPPKAQADDRAARPLDRHGLDAGWDRRLARGVVAPDFTLDLHGATLDAAHSRLEHGLALALAQGARLVLLITGRDRPSEDRRSRGAIRRNFMDWLAAGSHAGRIAAIRPAHPRHGGPGAVYLILRRAK